MPSENVERVDSCELAINQKGKYSGKIKVYSENCQDAINEAKRLGEELRKFMLKVNTDG